MEPVETPAAAARTEVRHAQFVQLMGLHQSNERTCTPGDDGREIWRYRYGEGYSVVPRPLHRDGVVYVCSGFNRAVLYAVRTDGEGDVTDTHLVWSDDKAVPKESSPILVGDLLFLNDDKGVLSCFDAKTGEERYRERLDGRGGYSAVVVT